MDTLEGHQSERETTYRLLRYVVATVMMFYGFAKLNHSQFTVLDSQLDLPLKEVSGFWLTWYYFGYSGIYGAAIAFAQIVPATLLLFRRTSLLGAFLLAPVLFNIVLIDFGFRIDPSATAIAILMLAADLALLWNRRAVLRTALLPLASSIPQARTGKSYFVMAWVVRFSIVCFAVGGTYWIANVNNRDPTPIDGAWQATSISPPGSSFDSVRFVYFEYNRAWMCVLRRASGQLETHGFRVEPKGHRIKITAGWMGDDAVIFEGTYRREEDRLALLGHTSGDSQAVEIDLLREPMPVQDHAPPAVYVPTLYRRFSASTHR